jgi:hypothetical protein
VCVVYVLNKQLGKNLANNQTWGTYSGRYRLGKVAYGSEQVCFPSPRSSFVKCGRQSLAVVWVRGRAFGSLHGLSWSMVRIYLDNNIRSSFAFGLRLLNAPAKLLNRPVEA